MNGNEKRNAESREQTTETNQKDEKRQQILFIEILV
jgi:hypothetical protein